MEENHRSETVRLIALAVTQIHASLTEGDNSVAALTESFEHLANISERVKTQQTDTHSEQVNNLTAEVNDHVTQAIVAFQFYDRLSQRLNHVAGSLEELSTLLDCDELIHESSRWDNLRGLIKSCYTMEAEHQMYDAIMQGKSVVEALEIYREEKMKPDEDDIELF